MRLQPIVTIISMIKLLSRLGLGLTLLLLIGGCLNPHHCLWGQKVDIELRNGKVIRGKVTDTGFNHYTVNGNIIYKDQIERITIER